MHPSHSLHQDSFRPGLEGREGAAKVDSRWLHGEERREREGWLAGRAGGVLDAAGAADAAREGGKINPLLSR